MQSWRWPALRHLPAALHAARYAEEIRRAALGGHAAAIAPLLDLAPVLRLGRIEAFEARLSAREGMQQAMLVPLRGDRFAISVDPTPPDGWQEIRSELRPSLRRHRFRFRVAHEIAHTLFYARGLGEPRRVVRDSPAQEDFCDEFARWLLIPPTVARATDLTGPAIMSLRSRFDVSLEVAARAVVAARESRVELSLWYTPRHGATPRLQWRAPGSGSKGSRKTSSTSAPDDALETAYWDTATGQALLIEDGVADQARQEPPDSG